MLAIYLDIDYVQAVSSTSLVSIVLNGSSDRAGRDAHPLDLPCLPKACDAALSFVRVKCVQLFNDNDA